MFGFRSKKQKMKNEEFFKYFKIETENGQTEVVADITNEDIVKWIYGVTTHIQKAFSKQAQVKNYVEGTFIIGGQEIAFAFIKRGGKTPNALLVEEKQKVADLEQKVKILELAYDQLSSKVE